MKYFKSHLRFFLIISLFVFSLNSLAASTVISPPQSGQTETEEEKKAKEEKTNWAVGLLKKGASSVAVAAIDWMVDFTKKYQKKINVSDLIEKVVGIKDTGPFKKYFDQFIISTPLVEIEDTPTVKLRTSGSIEIKGITLTAALEIGKNQNGSTYVVFYMKSPSKFLISQLFPDALNPATFFPKIQSAILKNKKPDLWEFNDIYFMITAFSVPDFKYGEKGKQKSIKLNAGFRVTGGARFADEGPIGILNAIFGFGKNDFMEIDMTLNVPNLVGSSIKMEISTKARILSNTVKFGGTQRTLIPGLDFWIELRPFGFSISVDAKMMPKVYLHGGFAMQTPFYSKPLEFDGAVDFGVTSINFYFGQKTDIKYLFGIPDLTLYGWHVGPIWDLGISETLAGMTAAVGGVGALIPSGIIFDGGIKTGKTDLRIEPVTHLDQISAPSHFNISSTKGVDFAIKMGGNLDFRDLIRFWIYQVAKRKDLADTILEKLKLTKWNLALKDVELDIAYSDKVSTHLGIKGQAQILPNLPPASLEISGDATGLKGKGFFPEIKIPSKSPILIISKSTKSPADIKGALLDLTVAISPSLNLECKINGYTKLNLGKVGILESDSLVNVSFEKIFIDTETDILGLKGHLKAEGMNDDGKIDPKKLMLDITIEQDGLLSLKDALKEAGTEVLAPLKAELEKKLDEYNAKLKTEMTKEYNNLKMQANAWSEDAKKLNAEAESYLQQVISASSAEKIKTCAALLFDNPLKAAGCTAKMADDLLTTKSENLRKQAAELTKRSVDALETASKMAGLSMLQAAVEYGGATARFYADTIVSLNEQLQEFLGDWDEMLKGGINPKKIRLQGSVEEFIAGNLGKVSGEIDVFGKTIALDLSINLKDVAAAATKTVKLGKFAIAVIKHLFGIK